MANYFFKILLIYYLVLFGLNSKCQTTDKNFLSGSWTNSKTDKLELIFYPNNTYKQFYDKVEMLSVFNVKRKANTYQINFYSDTAWLFVTVYNLRVNNKVKRKSTDHLAVQLNENYFTIISFKKGKGIYNHIDEYSNWVKSGDAIKKYSNKGTHIKYVFPSGFKGAAWIAFNQKDGIQPTYDSLGNPILIVPENGLLLTSIHEDAFATANRNYCIYESFENNYRSYKTYDKSDDIDSTLSGSEEYIAIMCGFNQDGRENINKFFKKEVSGNVMTIYIGKYKWFEQNPLHPWDSEMK